ncbi:hypothetical protein L484_026447 [Morus notabilis]|uniref:Uncharacterized protein n=1 Tax=Morus notabilis TaxID=981085 RepID=W9QNM7_9ROSA|nr:hypothetical protein L484_026447 [Morus notabilis]
MRGADSISSLPSLQLRNSTTHEDNDNNNNTTSTNSNPSNDDNTHNGDESLDLGRSGGGRGGSGSGGGRRPPGSKNKPKPLIVIWSHVLEIINPFFVGVERLKIQHPNRTRAKNGQFFSL